MRAWELTDYERRILSRAKKMVAARLEANAADRLDLFLTVAMSRAMPPDIRATNLSRAADALNYAAAYTDDALFDTAEGVIRVYGRVTKRLGD